MRDRDQPAATREDRAEQYLRRYENLTALLDYAAPKQESAASRRNSDKEWHGGVTFTQGMKLARTGWSKDRPAPDNLIGEISGALAERIDNAYQPVIGPIGAEVEMGLYLAGNPECMIGFELTAESAYREVVRILISTTCSAGIPAPIIRNRGIAVCALLDLVAQSGKAVELWAEDTVKSFGSDKVHTTLVCLKDSESYLDVDQVMYAVAHPSFQRRIVFSAQEQEGQEIRRTFGFQEGGGYGMPNNLTMGDEIGAQIEIDTLRDTTPFRTIPGMVEWITKQLDTLGLLVKEG